MLFAYTVIVAVVPATVLSCCCHCRCCLHSHYCSCYCCFCCCCHYCCCHCYCWCYAVSVATIFGLVVDATVTNDLVVVVNAAAVGVVVLPLFCCCHYCCWCFWCQCCCVVAVPVVATVAANVLVNVAAVEVVVTVRLLPDAASVVIDEVAATTVIAIITLKESKKKKKRSYGAGFEPRSSCVKCDHNNHWGRLSHKMIIFVKGLLENCKHSLVSHLTFPNLVLYCQSLCLSSQLSIIKIFFII